MSSFNRRFRLDNTTRNVPTSFLRPAASSYGFLVDDEVLWRMYLRTPAHWQPLDGIPVVEGPRWDDENEEQGRAAQRDE